jgi:hypothetical protein
MSLAVSCGTSSSNSGSSDAGMDGETTSEGGSSDATIEGSPVTCVPGQQTNCGCPGGSIGVQVCAATNSYGGCACQEAGVSADAGTDGADATVDGAATACVPGQQINCGCLGGSIGIQVCSPDGTMYGGCACATLDASSAHDAATDATVDGSDASTDATFDGADGGDATQAGSSDASGCGTADAGDGSPPTTFAVAGSVIGLTGTGLVLANNGGDTLPISANGCFSFSMPVDSGAAYDVTIQTQPTGPTCTVFNGSGAAGPYEPSLVVTCGRTPVATATGQSSPVSIAVDKNNVYWTDEYPYQGFGGGVIGPAVVKAPLDGGAPTVLAASPAPSGIAVDDTYVYWTDQLGGNGVMRVPIDGGATVTLVHGNLDGGQPYQATAITLDANNVYFTSPYGPSAGYVMSVPKDGGAPFVIASGQGYPDWGLAVDATNVYWVNSGTNAIYYRDSAVMMAPITGVPDGGSPTILASYPVANAPNQVAVDSTNVYWANSSGTVMKIPKAGGCPVTLASGQGNAPWGLAVDGTNVYWTDEGYTSGTVMTVPIAGGCVTGLAAGNNLLGIAVDSTNVYWVDQGCGSGSCTGSVWKAPKN